MRASARVAARQQIDNRMKPLEALNSLDRPNKGWIRAIREALGMTMAQMGSRMGVSASRIAALETAEANAGVTLKSLERAAAALDCRLAYVLVPRRPLTDLVTERSEALAHRRLQTVRHHMALEDQSVLRVEDDAQFTDLVRSLSKTAGAELWEAE